MPDSVFVNNIFLPGISFEEKAFDLFAYQYQYNPVYKLWCHQLNQSPQTVKEIHEIPFLPVSFFKTHRVAASVFQNEFVFESSGTTQTNTSHHYVKDIDIYRESFITCFEHFYGPVKDLCILGLLPSYLEREHSSLVFMVEELIKLSSHLNSGFYLYEQEKLHQTLLLLEQQKQNVLLIGVTFALLDFAEKFPMPLQHTTIMETGGMKGRRKELLRQEVHEILCRQFQIKAVHSEYGMTELLSQAYSKGEGVFTCPHWMKVLVRDENDPLAVTKTGKGLLNIIDLANIYSCPFIAVDDAGIVNTDGSFEVAGRSDNSDLRGCSLLSV